MKQITKLEILEAQTPSKTHSYTPVSNSILLNTIEEKLYKHDLQIVSQRFDANASKTQMFGVYELGNSNGSERMNIGFRNSYDKSLAVGMVAGSTVLVCSNLMFKGDVKVLRKHTNGVFNDLETLIENVVLQTEQQFNLLQVDKAKMKEIEMNRRDMAELAGQMFINDNLITSTQLNIIKREINFSENFTDPTLWSFYNHCTEALKVAHPAEVLQSHINLHDYVLELV